MKEAAMKKARDDKPVHTIPKGAYESGNINAELRKNKNNKLNDITTDSNGNGYPVNKQQ